MSKLERVTHDIMLEQRRLPGGRREWVAIVAAGDLSAGEVAKAIERARMVLSTDPRPIARVECVLDDSAARAARNRTKARAILQ